MLTKTKKRSIITLVVAVFAMGFFVVPHLPALAQVSTDFPTSFAGFSSQDLKVTIQNIVRIILGFVGFIFLLLLLYGGFTWMTSGGDEKKIMRAKKIITSAVIGLLITLSSYAIAGFIIRSFTGASQNGGVGSGTGTGPGGFGFALGSGALESHYPGRNASDIPRNTNIYVTFKESMNVGTICNGGVIFDPAGTSASMRLHDVQDAVNPDPNDPDGDNYLDAVDCAPTDATNRTFRFNPGGGTTNHLGTNNGNVTYVVILTRNIQTADGETALPLDYSWRFTVNSVIDETPPTVASVFPSNGSLVPRNSMVQINFSEAVDPTSASGLYAPGATPPSTYDSITLDLTDPALAPFLEGSYASGNQYRTTEFVSNELCGQNSCGENVYCLPGDADVFGVVTGTITDMAGNQLDGDGNGTAGGNYTWQFRTTNAMDLVPPEMIARRPRSTAVDWPVAAPIEMDFSKALSVTSLTSGNVGLGRIEVPYTPPGPSALANEGNYWISSVNGNYDADPNPETRVFINHDLFLPLTPYHPGADAEIRDLNQNCYFPSSCTVAGQC